MTDLFRDKFDREDGEIGSNYTVACGNATIFDEAVLPVTDGSGNSGLSPQLAGTTRERTQVLYTADGMDSKDYSVRGVWSHDAEILGERPLSELPSLTASDPRFTLLARMTKDPMLVDLGRAQEPACYDQGYGLRVKCPRDGSAPILSIVKFMPPAVPPGIARPASSEPDGAQILASVTLQAMNLITDPEWDGTGNIQYQGYVQEIRLRIRRADNQVLLEAFLNDRNMNTPILEYTDHQDPTWGVVGVPGFEFLSPELLDQSGNSPFNLVALPIMRCHLFEVQTVKDFHRPYSVVPSNLYTYDRCIDRVILLVEKNGDAKYGATGSGTRRDTYLGFIMEAEAHIIREVGYYEWLRKEARVFLDDERAEYELPADIGLINFIRPSWNSPPLREELDWRFANRIGATRGGGMPRIYRRIGESVNNRPRISVYPVPSLSESAEVFLTIEYFARQIFPSEPDVELPLIPQEHIDVLVYGATAHALLLDTDQANAENFAKTFASKLQQLKRDAHRNVSGRQMVMKSAADLFIPDEHFNIPVTRAASLESLLLF